MTPEGRIVAAVKRELDKRGIFHINLNGGNGQTGLPDRLAFPHGRVLPIECKAPGTGRVAPKQAWVHEQFAKAGWPVLVVDDVAQLREWLDAPRRPPYDREALATILVYHWRTDMSGCGCGWAELGRSHPEHILDVYEDSIARRDAA
jgi:hypothetical protein